jgi:hypothetical protein
MTLGVLEHRETIRLIARQDQGAAFPGKYVAHGTTADYEHRAQIYREIGEIVDHSNNTLMFAPDYGYSLAYHGRLDGEILYPESKHLSKDFDALYEENSPRYLIVLKRFAYYPRQVRWGGPRQDQEYKGLRTRLKKDFGVKANDRFFIVFDLRETGNGRPKHSK